MGNDDDEYEFTEVANRAEDDKGGRASAFADKLACARKESEKKDSSKACGSSSCSSCSASGAGDKDTRAKAFACLLEKHRKKNSPKEKTKKRSKSEQNLHRNKLLSGAHGAGK